MSHDYFTDVLATFLGLDLRSTEGQRALRFYQKHLNLCFEDELERHEGNNDIIVCELTL